MKSNNMKRSAFIIVTFLFIVLAAKGQSIEEIQTSKDYIWGTGNAATLKKADNEALAALISQISTNVSSKFEQLTEGGMKDDQATVDETFKSVINTYSRATLNNTRRIVIQNDPEAVVMRYIKVAEIQRIFDTGLCPRSRPCRKESPGGRCPALLLLGARPTPELPRRQLPHHER